MDGSLWNFWMEVHVDRFAQVRARHERSLPGRGHVLRYRAALLHPQGIFPVEQRDLFVAQPPQHPPEAHREVAAEVVVYDDLRVGRDAALVDLGCEYTEVRERMAAVVSGLSPERSSSVCMKYAPGMWPCA
jgi:hypothetical protein